MLGYNYVYKSSNDVNNIYINLDFKILVVKKFRQKIFPPVKKKLRCEKFSSRVSVTKIFQ